MVSDESLAHWITCYESELTTHKLEKSLGGLSTDHPRPQEATVERCRSDEPDYVSILLPGSRLCHPRRIVYRFRVRISMSIIGERE